MPLRWPVAASLSDLFFPRQERQDRQVKVQLPKNGLRTRDSLAMSAIWARDHEQPEQGAPLPPGQSGQVANKDSPALAPFAEMSM